MKIVKKKKNLIEIFVLSRWRDRKNDQDINQRLNIQNNLYESVSWPNNKCYETKTLRYIYHKT